MTRSRANEPIDTDHAYYCKWCGWSENEQAKYQTPCKAIDGDHVCNVDFQRREAQKRELRLIPGSDAA